MYKIHTSNMILRINVGTLRLSMIVVIVSVFSVSVFSVRVFNVSVSGSTAYDLRLTTCDLR